MPDDRDKAMAAPMASFERRADGWESEDEREDAVEQSVRNVHRAIYKEVDRWFPNRTASPLVMCDRYQFRRDILSRLG